MDTAGHQRFSGPPDVWWKGPPQFIAVVLILMSDGCGFVRNHIRENPDATAPATANNTDTTNNHNLWARILLPLDARISNE